MNEVATPAALAPGPGCRLDAAWASQIGITVAFLLLWLTFIVLAPGTFLSERIYLSFAQTTPYFAIVAMPLTMVIIAGDIDLSFPSIMALGMVGFVWVWQATGSVGAGGRRRARGRRAGRPVQRPDRHVHRASPHSS